MSHKKNKPKNKGQQQKQKKLQSSIVSADLITGKQFKKIIDLLHSKKELTNRDRYLYGYALLSTQNNLEALITLWPLASKNQKKIQEDCAILAAHVFKEENSPLLVGLPEDALYILFHAARHLLPKNPVNRELKQWLIPLLWQAGNYEKLEHVIKSSVNEPTAISIETLSKLAFFQSEKKLPGNIIGFIGHTLTGGACLIARDPTYHNDILDKMNLLGNELKLMYSQLSLKTNHKLAWKPSLFNNFVDYDVSILTQVLTIFVEKTAQKNAKLNFDIIPSPSYINHYETTDRQTSKQFLIWLASENETLSDMYQRKTALLVIWALGGEKLSVVTQLLNEYGSTQLHPYLRLALMLRAENIKKSSLNGLVELSDFEKLEDTATVFKSVVIQTLSSIINNTSQSKISPDFWQMVIHFYPVLQDPRLKNSLIAQSLNELHQQHKNHDTLDLSNITTLACQLNVPEFEKQVDALHARQQACSQFWMTISSEKLSKKSIRAIKNKPMLETHLTFIADYFLLIFSGLSRALYLHLKNLVTNKRLNKLVPLTDLLECNFECGCVHCIDQLFHDDLPKLVKKLNLPVAQLPKPSHDLTLESGSKPLTSRSSVLSEPDPFKILDSTCTDSKQAIMQQVMKLIQQSPEKMSEFRHAQSELFNPTQRFLHHYFRIVSNDSTPLATNAEKSVPCSLSLQIPLQDIPFRHEFLNAN